MPSRHLPLLITAAAFGAAAIASLHAQSQSPITRPPTSTDWAALAKLPDLTGVWEAGGGGGGGRGGGGAARGAAGGGAPRGAGDGAARGAGGGGAARGGRGGGMQLTPAAEAKRKDLQSKPVEDNQTANCLPPGMPGIMGQPYPMEFLLTPGKVTIVIEAYQQVRHIYTDGRPLPADPEERFHGTSIGRWEGDTLVVDTIGFSPLTQIAANVPHSGKMKIVERFRLADPDTMSIETTVTDPEVLAAPLVSTRSLRRHRDWTTAEYICEENNRNFVDQNGKAGIRLTPPGSK
jgi:hypothetical protein